MSDTNTLITPVFIFGSYRSGTTMLASQLAANSNAIALPEMPFIQMLITSTASTMDEITTLYHRMTATFHFRASGIDIDLPTFSQPFLVKAEPAERVYNLLRHHFQLNENEPKTWIEHTPHNRERVDLYKAIFPQAKFIHIVRDPRAVYASMHNLLRWNSHDPIAFASNWNIATTYSFTAKARQSHCSYELRYEDYILHQETKLIELCDFIGIANEECMKNGGGISLPHYTKKQHSLVGKQVDKTRINAWQSSISLREAQLITWRCLPWMLHYNYCNKNEAIHPPRTLEALKYKIKQKLLSPLSKIKRIKDNLST
jgi:hypothetical protein